MAPKSRQAASLASNGSASSLSQASESVKTVFRKGVKALAQLFKKAKTHFSTRSKSSTTIDEDIASRHATDKDNVSTLAGDSSGIEIVEVDPEKELSMFNHYFC
jgi:hypothetical protein